MYFSSYLYFSVRNNLSLLCCTWHIISLKKCNANDSSIFCFVKTRKTMWKNSFISPLIWKVAEVQCKCHVFLSLSLIWSNSAIILLPWKHAESQNNAVVRTSYERFMFLLFYRATATSITLIKLPTHALRAKIIVDPFAGRRNCHMAEHFK